METTPAKSVCRVCLTADSKNVSLLEQHKDLPIYLHINSLSNVDIKENDGLPDKICISCVLDLDTAITFKEKCEGSNLLLQSSPDCWKTKEVDINYTVVKKKEPYNELEYLEDTVDNEQGLCDSEEEVGPEIDEERKPLKKPNKVELGLRESRAINLQCDDCKEYFKSKCKLRDHWKNVHLKEYLKSLKEDMHVIYKDYQPKDNHFKESFLAKVESLKQTKNGLESESLDNNGDYEDFNIVNEDDKPSKKPNKVELGLRESRAINLQLQCDDCKEFFKSKFKLRVHWKKVHLKDSLTCFRCKRTFNCYQAYNKHKQSKIKSCVAAESFRIEVEGKKRRFYCKECNYNSYQIIHMLTHQVMHTGDRKFKCDICFKSFGQMGSLNAHKEIHPEYRNVKPCPYCAKMYFHSRLTRHLKTHFNKVQCPKCNRKLKNKSTLEMHILRNHSGVKTFTCNLCAQTFRTQGELFHHKKMKHIKGYNCDKCNYKCHDVKQFYAHKKKHNNDKRTHCCNVCGWFFEKIENLHRHMKQHSEIKRHSCPYCDAKFLMRGSMNNHIKKLHGSLSARTGKTLKLEPEPNND